VPLDIHAVYRIRSDARSIANRARTSCRPNSCAHSKARGTGSRPCAGEVATHDLIAVPPMTWHQFRATGKEPLGFLCMVNAARDKPQLPTPQELANLSKIRGSLTF
jgi:hypothetical protein